MSGSSDSSRGTDGAALHPQARRHLKRNFALGVVNGSVFRFGDAFQDINLVLSVFVNRLSDSTLAVGLLTPLRFGGWFLPQLLISARVQAAPAKMRYYRLGAVMRTGASFALALAALTVRDPAALLALTFVCMAAFSLAGGLSGISFMDIVGKAIPAERRGRFFATRLFVGGVLSLVASFIVRLVLGDGFRLPFPQEYGVLFLLSAVGVGVSMTAFALVREPIDGQVRPAVGVRHQLGRAGALLRANSDYRNFVLARVFLMGAQVAAPFYIIYARNVLGMPGSTAGTYLIVLTVANIASTYAWGWMSDRMGNRAVVRSVCILGALAPALGLSAGPIAAMAGGDGPGPAILMGLVFVILGANRSGLVTGGMGLLLDLAPADNRPIYIGLTNTIIGIASLTNVLGGVVVETLSFAALFAAALVFHLAAAVAITATEEPRGVVSAES